MLAAWSAAVLAPIMAELAAVRQAGGRKDDVIRDQAEAIGRLTAELDRAHREIQALTAPATPDPPDLTPGLLGPLTASEPVSAPWWRRWLLAIHG
jgi:hypothetical protein